MAKTETPKIVTRKHQARLDRENNRRRIFILSAIAVAVLVVLVLAYGILDTTYLKQIRPVVKVDGQVITARDFEAQVRYQRYNLVNRILTFKQYGEYFASYVEQYQSMLDNTQQLGQDILDQMVNDVVVAQEAKKLGISVSDAEVDAKLQEGFSYFPNGTPTPTLTPTTFATGTPDATQMALVPPTATLAPTSAPTESAETATPTAAPTATAAPTEGPTPTIEPTWTPFPTPTEITLDGYKTLYDEYLTTLKDIQIPEQTLRNLYRYSLLQEKVMAEVTKDVAPVQEQVWARHILVATEDEAKAVLDRLSKGEDWNKIAAEVSTDTSNNTNGGDLGWFPRHYMVKEFEDAAFALGVGEISQPVKTEFGYHIIQVVGHEQERPLMASTLEQVKQKVYSDWLTGVKETKKIETFDLWKQILPTEPTVPAGQ